MKPTITDIIARIKANSEELGITLFAPASSTEIAHFEGTMGVKLPDDFVEFYSFANGFESEEDVFRIVPLNEIIIDNKMQFVLQPTDFHFAEYLVYCDSWAITINPANKNDYSIYNRAKNVITLTNSFAGFLDTFLNGGVFDGLYEWRDKIEASVK